MKMKVIINADDYGLTKGITDGIIESHVNGVVGSATLMMNGMAVDYAVELAKRHPSLKVGIHLVLTWGKPLAKDVPDIVNEDGLFKFKNTFSLMEPPRVDQVEGEWRTQIEAFLATGLPLHHIDSHHHVHGWEPLKEVIIKLAKEYQVPVRYVDSIKDHKELLLTEDLWLDFYGEGVSEDLFEKIKNLNVSSIEIMCHPAYVDQDLRSVSSYTDLRKKELEILCHLKMPSWASDVS